MIRVSEAVLPGHPDKFCDQVADAIVAEAYRVDPRAYCQAEVGVWSDQLWVSGAAATRQPFERPLEEIVHEVGRAIGYTGRNAIDVERYRITDTLCRHTRDPREWTDHVNDQAIVVGWAGYDAKIDYLSPEHFLATRLQEALFASCHGGELDEQGPDGKLLVRVREGRDAWALESVLVSLQHLPELDVVELSTRVGRVVASAYDTIRSQDPRWVSDWGEVDLLVNPNGPFERGGSDGDNGQTGRKLVMDYYGPRVAIGGGAIFGKDLAHIDRAGAYETRRIAVDVVESGAEACRVVASYAPNQDAPIDVSFEIEGGGRPPDSARERLGHDALREAWRVDSEEPGGSGWRPGGRGLRGV